MIDKSWRPALPVRMAAQGTRVIVLRGSPPHVAGFISEVRPQPHLKTYVVTCDDGAVVFASPYDLALEADGSISPLGPRPEY